MQPDQVSSGRSNTYGNGGRWTGLAVAVTLLAAILATTILAIRVLPVKVGIGIKPEEGPIQSPNGVAQVELASRPQSANTNSPPRNFTTAMLTVLDRATNFQTGDIVLPGTGDQSVDSLLMLFLQFVDRWRETFSDLSIALETAGEPDLFSQEVLGESIKLRQALDEQLARRKIVEHYRSVMSGDTQWITDSVASTRAAGPLARRMLNLVDEGIRTCRGAADERFEACSGHENAKERFLKFILDAFPKYSLYEGGISFNLQTDLEEYVRMTSEISNCAAAFEQYESRALGRLETFRDRLKRVADQQL